VFAMQHGVSGFRFKHAHQTCRLGRFVISISSLSLPLGHVGTAA
jgi:hypothetical protein